MTGQLILVPLNLDGDDLSEYIHNLEDEHFLEFRYSYWGGKFKGDILRSLISYLEDVDKREPFTPNVLPRRRAHLVSHCGRKSHIL